MSGPSTSKREALKVLGTGALCAICSGTLPNVSEAASRPKIIQKKKTLNLVCINTGERFKGEFSSRSSRRELNKLLRDYRTNGVKDIDRKLYDHLYDVTSKFGEGKEIQVICGYRSKETNEKLRKRSRGVALKSLHIEGKAIDFRMPGISMSKLKIAARNHSTANKTCGVGSYKSFIHLDTGSCRCWGI